MKKLRILYIIIALGMVACSCDKKQTESVVSDVQINVKQSEPDTIASSVQKEAPEVKGFIPMKMAR